MKSHTKYLIFKTEKRIDFLNITEEIEDAIKKSKIKEGLVLINPMHITAAIYVNDAESGLIQDFKEWLEKSTSMKHNYHHNNTGEDNGYAHIWRQMMGHQVTMAVTNGSLDLGPWEQIYYAEFDGQRSKRVLVKIIGE
ncbi:YjbQ family protein [Candidatus Woesearchaeota archaeon]|nr:YjbQ family protein [Candidatus Woesearchaeota archaeon]